MQRSDVDVRQLRRRVESDIKQYAADYIPPSRDTVIGIPWTQERVSQEVERMAPLLVDPYPVEYKSSDDMLPPEDRLIGIRSAFVVAQDHDYLLLFDHDAEDFVLAVKLADGRLTAWGIRGDAASTFLSR